MTDEELKKLDARSQAFLRWGRLALVPIMWMLLYSVVFLADRWSTRCMLLVSFATVVWNYWFVGWWPDFIKRYQERNQKGSYSRPQ